MGISIVDYPRWPFRALKIDTSRHFLPVPILKAALDGMEAAKMNVFLWHAVDGNSFPLESATYPDLTHKGAYDAASVYTLADVADVVAYAQARGVRVVPELDIPGHQGVGYARPELVACPLLEGFGGNARALDVTKNATYEFLRQWLGEMVEAFGDPQVNVYGDEVQASCWEASPSVQAFMKAHGIADYAALTTYFWARFVKEVLPSLRKKGVDSLIVGEARQLGTDGPPLAPLPADTLVEVWGPDSLEQSANGTLRGVLQAGFKAYLGGTFYLDQKVPHTCASGWPYCAPHLGGYHEDDWENMLAVEPLGDPELTAAQKRELEEDELLEVGGDPSFLPDFAPDADAGWDGEIDEEAHFDPID